MGDPEPLKSVLESVLDSYFTAAWIFLSIGDAAGGGEKWVRLPDLIAAADVNNHAIPTAEELTHAVSDLVAAGLVETYETDTRLTAPGRAEYEEARGPSGGPMGLIDGVFALGERWRDRQAPGPAPQRGS